MILFGEEALRTTVREFITHYHYERHHQGIGNVLIMPDPGLANRAGPVRCRSRRGGLLNYYDRAAYTRVRPRFRIVVRPAKARMFSAG